MLDLASSVHGVRVTLPTGQGGVHLFVVYGYQGSEEDADKLLLTDRLLQAVLAEAQVACVGQPLLIVGDLSADPSSLLGQKQFCWQVCRPGFAHSLGAGKEPDAVLGLPAPMLWPLPLLVRSPIGGSHSRVWHPSVGCCDLLPVCHPAPLACLMG